MGLWLSGGDVGTWGWSGVGGGQGRRWHMGGGKGKRWSGGDVGTWGVVRGR